MQFYDEKICRMIVCREIAHTATTDRNHIICYILSHTNSWPMIAGYKTVMLLHIHQKFACIIKCRWKMNCGCWTWIIIQCITLYWHITYILHYIYIHSWSMMAGYKTVMLLHIRHIILKKLLTKPFYNRSTKYFNTNNFNAPM